MTYHRPRRAKVLTTPKEAAAAAADAASASAWAILQPGVGAVVLAGGLLLLLANTLSPVGGACNVSNVFGDHMVLQRAPQHAVIWGFAQPDTKVKTRMGTFTVKSTADATGMWKALLPATPMSTVSQDISFSCSTGERFMLTDVLFGDVHICGGQSNMQFTLGCIGEQDGYDAPGQIAQADNYPYIRTITVGQPPPSYHPVVELQSITLPWSVASSKVIGLGNWSATSALCWYYAKELYDQTHVPQGIISSNWAGTIIQSWMPNTTNAKCTTSHTRTSRTRTLPRDSQTMAKRNLAAEPVEDPELYRSKPTYIHPAAAAAAAADTGAAAVAAAAISGANLRKGGTYPDPNSGYGVLFNSMINPFTVGPMGIASIIWHQGESNVLNNQPASYYACAQPAMVTQWREHFKNPSAFFGYVVLEPWIGAPTSLAAFRTAQLLTNELSNTGYAIGTDVGDPRSPHNSIHPRSKRLVAKRLAAAALTHVYNTPTQYLPPTYKSASAVSGDDNSLTVTVSFDNVPTTLATAADHCKTELNVASSSCAWFSITGSDNVVLNATATVGDDGTSVVLTAIADAAGVTATASSFGMNAWPINTIMSAEGFPLQPWSFPIFNQDQQ